ncbi:hypothetical protein [Actinospongicola halichondriae]|uniref:hypothetical protein n=1 Tax=Actinospongicola halichondriae TaxID=3236844 RepID=UPI003D5986AC
MLAFFAIEMVGTLLAPTFIDTAPLFVVAISPGDHHIALARSANWLTLFALALTVRSVKYYITFRMAGDGLDEMRRVGLHRAARIVDGRIARRSWALSVFFLPGMWAGMLCASQKVPHRRYVVVMVTTTAMWVAASVAAAEALNEPLVRITDTITNNSVEATLVVAAALTAFLVVRFLRLDRSADVDPTRLPALEESLD